MWRKFQFPFLRHKCKLCLFLCSFLFYIGVGSILVGCMTSCAKPNKIKSELQLLLMSRAWSPRKSFEFFSLFLFLFYWFYEKTPEQHFSKSEERSNWSMDCPPPWLWSWYPKSIPAWPFLIDRNVPKQPSRFLSRCVLEMVKKYCSIHSPLIIAWVLQRRKQKHTSLPID